MKKIMLLLGILIGNALMAQSDTLDSIIRREQSALPNDPIGVEIYQLPNGAHVYLSVNRETPKVVAKVGFAAGAFNDPEDRTGLAHYLEHLLFKGSQNVGTTNYPAESKILARIESLYDQRTQTTDTEKRAEFYREIDRLSGDAASYIIPNEFVLALKSMGAQGINAYTSYDRTVYISTLPKNELEKWLKLEYDRYSNPVFRGFHSELETVYEELNMSYDNPSRRWFFFIYDKFYKGTPLERPVLGRQEHLLNPSPSSVMKFYKEHYVPRNMVICLSGDLDTVRTLNALNDTLGKLEDKPYTRVVKKRPAPIQGEHVYETVLPGNSRMQIQWLVDTAPSNDLESVLFMASQVLSNGSAGLIDQHINIPQRALGASGSGYIYCDIPVFSVSAEPRMNDSVYAIKDMLDAEVEKLKKGDFPDWLLPTIVRNYKLGIAKSVKDNEWRANRMLDAFIEGQSWDDVTHSAERLSKVTKQDVMDFANRYLTKDRMIFIRHNGTMAPIHKLPKIPMTPIQMDFKAQSKFYKNWAAIPTQKLDPVFPVLDSVLYNLAAFKNIVKQYNPSMLDMTEGLKFQLVALENKRDDFFTLQIRYPIGAWCDSALGLSFSYMNAAGTQKRTPEQLRIDLYQLAGSINFSSDEYFSYVTISGLTESRDSLMAIANDYFESPKVDTAVLKAQVNRVLLNRKNVKQDPEDILFEGLLNYARYGRKSAYLSGMDSKELKSATPEFLISRFQNIRTYTPEIRYYGKFDASSNIFNGALRAFIPTKTKRPPTPPDFVSSALDTPMVLFVNVPNVRQVQMMFLKRGVMYTSSLQTVTSVFNSYYGSGMSSVVFQNLRESNALCYSCQARYDLPNYPMRHALYYVYLTTQPDKIKRTVETIDAIGFPADRDRIEEARNTRIQNVLVQRYNDWDYVGLYDYLRRMNLEEDVFRTRWETLQRLKPIDLNAFYNTYVTGRPSTLIMVGDKTMVDMNYLSTLGKVYEIPVDELFPY